MVIFARGALQFQLCRARPPLSASEQNFTETATLSSGSALILHSGPFRINDLKALPTFREWTHNCFNVYDLHLPRRLAMAYFERVRDVISQPFSPEIIRQRTAAGWQMVSIEWRRELPDSEAPPEHGFNEDIPYGLRISDDCKRLEVNPHENQVLLLMMDLLAQDFSYASIVSDLNEKGFRTREGRPWSRVAVFNMMPRLIEVGPRIFSSQEWEKRRVKIARREAP